MSPNGKHLYRFGEFSFDTDEEVLKREGLPVPLTPKMFELLLVFVRNHGRIVEKDDLMKAVWPESFVEEGNLAFTVRQLRKTLQDDAHHPAYIETIPRRGYRFIAEVDEVSSENALKDEVSAISGTAGAAATKYKRFLIPLIAAFCVLLITIAIGSWYARRRASEVPVLSAPFASEKLSTNGKVYSAVITPDGENVVYTNSTEGRESVWLRELASGNNVEIIPASDNDYNGFAFSPDGNFLYFTRRPRNIAELPAIYRTSIFGGIPAKIVDKTQGWVTVSPDGSKIGFVRCPYTGEEFCSLWIADSVDGKNEIRLTSRPNPMRITAPVFAPDGRSIAFGFGQSENAANEFSIAEIDLETGAEHELTSEKFFNIKVMAWLPDKSGLLMTASRIPNRNFRIWQVSALTGEAIPLTKDSETYAGLSLNRSATRLVSTQVKPDFHLVLSGLENPSERRILADAMLATFAPSGTVVFSSTMSGNDEIWSMNADGSGQRQLTNDIADDRYPVVSPDSKTIYFFSNRTGEMQVWRMDADGSDQGQITQKNGGMPFFASPDGEWVYYHHGIDRTLWRVSLRSGEERLVLDKKRQGLAFAFSHDGMLVAYGDTQDDESVLTIASLVDGQPIRSIPLADGKARLVEASWLPDGRSLAYILADREFENNTLWIQPADGGKPQKIADLGDDETHSLRFAQNRKTFAYIQGGWKYDAVLLKGFR